MLAELKSITAATAKAKALSAIRTFPSIVFSALVIGWAAEAAQFLASQDEIVTPAHIRDAAV
ncbi:MAG: hypothetical protein WBC88_07800 [Candidatus Zixiibacteriota bacterium]|jgi:hypothetical protein